MGGKGSFWAGRKRSWRGGADAHLLSALVIDFPLALVVTVMMVMLSSAFGSSVGNLPRLLWTMGVAGWGMLLGVGGLDFLLNQTFPPGRRWALLPFLLVSGSTCVKRIPTHPSAFRRNFSAAAAAFCGPMQEKALKLCPGVAGLAQALQPLDKSGCVHFET
jgi:hypothetical protein